MLGKLVSYRFNENHTVSLSVIPKLPLVFLNFITYTLISYFNFVMNSSSQFINPNDPNIVPFGKSKKPKDPRWATCPIGQAFIVHVEESLVRSGKKRPTIPAAYVGQYKTKAIQQPWGYMVHHFRGD